MNSPGSSPGAVPESISEPHLLNRVRATLRVRHYSLRTEEYYIQWIRRFILFHHKRHPLEMGATEINAFLTHLAVDRTVSASTQNQAFSALLFLYRAVLEVDPGQLAGVVRAMRPKRLPVVLTRAEVRRVIDHLDGTYRLMARLLYGSGLRLLECLRLRVKDVDFGRNE
ncbi:MAG: phage integrase N-terminal SAM-like domain-containing protein, partial [Thermogemmata sp.]